jgi:hypothetical protein
MCNPLNSASATAWMTVKPLSARSSRYWVGLFPVQAVEEFPGSITQVKEGRAVFIDEKTLVIGNTKLLHGFFVGLIKRVGLREMIYSVEEIISELLSKCYCLLKWNH